MIDDKKSFGQYIRRKRQEAKFTQLELAEMLFVASSTVSKWERGLSYPDVSLIPEICRLLAISEHEFFTACDDEKQFDEDRALVIRTRVIKVWTWFSTIACAVTLIVCLLCNLLIRHTLDWFWIVLTAVALGYCLTTLPFLLRWETLARSMGGATLSLLLLLFSCWQYVGGSWILGGLAIAAISLALPWGIWILWRCYGRSMVPLSAALFSVWIFALLAVIHAFTGGNWLTALAYPICVLCLFFLWALLSILLWLPANRWCKGAAITALAALSIPTGNTLPIWLSSIREGLLYFASYFNSALPFPSSQIANRISFWILLAAALVLFIVGMVQGRARNT